MESFKSPENLIAQETLNIGQVLSFAEKNKQELEEYRKENKERQPGVLSTMVILKLFFGHDISHLRILDIGCGKNALIDRILKKEGAELIGCDPTPGIYEEFLHKKFGHKPRENAPQEASFPVYPNIENIPIERQPVDAVISIRFFGFPLLRKGAERATYENAQGDKYVQWLRNFDKETTKEEFLNQLKKIATTIKENGLVIIVFQPNPDFTYPNEGEIWNELMTAHDIEESGFVVLKDRSLRGQAGYYGESKELEEISFDLAADYRETVVLQRHESRKD